LVLGAYIFDHVDSSSFLLAAQEDTIGARMVDPSSQTEEAQQAGHGDAEEAF